MRTIRQQCCLSDHGGKTDQLALYVRNCCSVIRKETTLESWFIQIIKSISNMSYIWRRQIFAIKSSCSSVTRRLRYNRILLSIS